MSMSFIGGLDKTEKFFLFENHIGQPILAVYFSAHVDSSLNASTKLYQKLRYW